MSEGRLILTSLPGVPLIQAGDDLTTIILDALQRASLPLIDGDVIVLGQKIVSKAEGRVFDLEHVRPSREAEALAEETEKDPRVVELILGESRRVLRKRVGLIIVEHRLGFVCANAGIDRSNVERSGEDHGEKVLLLPEDPDATALKIQRGIQDATDANVAVLIIDSHGRAWRMGTVGVAIGAANFPALLDLRGEEDLFGYKLQSTEVGLADEVAAAASVLMGQASEGRPIVHLRGLPYPLREGSLQEIIRPPSLDLFR
jgi:coenzyme F420-0:L-glutamate ligase/coenzyme F420-1:gamma-L-glutamate ligase